MKYVQLSVLLLALFTSCASSPTQEERDQIINLSNEIADLSRVNESLTASYPKQQQAVDTLLKFLNSTNHEYTKEVLINAISTIQGDIEKNRAIIAENAIVIDKDRLGLKRIISKDEEVLLKDTLDHPHSEHPVPVADSINQPEASPVSSGQ